MTRKNGGARSRVTTYLGPRAFYTRDMEKKTRAGQRAQPLPPRCGHCRRSWDVVMRDGSPHCAAHFHDCDGTCGITMENTGTE